MAQSEDVRQIMGKLQAKASLTEEELSSLQSFVDQLEIHGLAAETEHHTSSSPGSHYTDHRTSVADIAGLLDRISRIGRGAAMR